MRVSLHISVFYTSFAQAEVAVDNYGKLSLRYVII